jgi:hypothetical protein
MSNGNSGAATLGIANELGAGKEISPRYLQAINAIATGKVPESAIQRHPGKGGKVFTYISHIWVNEQIRQFFDQGWSFDILSGNMLGDGSAIAYGRLTLYIPLSDGSIFERHVTEVGAFEGADSMPQAMKVASAASRSLVRCAMRAFGLGAEFYVKEEYKMTAQEAWLTLKEYVRRNHGDEQELIRVLKELEIKGSDLANPDVFETAYTVAYNLSREGKDRFGQLPAELDGIPAAAQTENAPAPVKSMETPVEQAPKAEPVKAEQPKQTPEEKPAKVEQPTPAPMAEPAKVEQPIQTPEAEPVKVEQPRQKPVATAPAAPAPVNGNGNGSKPQPPAPVADLQWKPKSWDEITEAVAHLGYDLQDVIALLSKTYGPGSFDIKKLQDYWLLTAHHINEGNIRKLD